MLHYILRPDHSIYTTWNLREWARWYETADRHVGDTLVPFNDGSDEGIRVSTVFMGIDHNYGDSPEPILFETMAFWPPEKMTIFGRERMISSTLDLIFKRYSTWEQAEKGHAVAVREVQSFIEDSKQKSRNWRNHEGKEI